ncbi:MinD/ParA family ATP-binding protein [Desulfobotulus mexicanus]|uniref:MinD/ParA family protein n=1 Tax=Desulfobotulus mexicanus TaxID=2586642 RepID=A0A5S5MEX8_9BACT|nr:P-loop NTPase [Desulfobotulus mexicanus]TYT74250.1 MinD/ParA family protein [Desulfobotulus mexicanus]
MGEIIAFGGGKGGSGKSFLISLTGSLLAAAGKKVVLVDLDLGAANLHSFFGISVSKPGLQDFMEGRAASLSDCCLETSIPRLSLISSKGCTAHVADLPAGWVQRLIQGFRTLPHECILLDLGAGTYKNNLDFFLAASRGVLVTTPEPTAVENLFRFIHALFMRKIRGHVGDGGLRELTRICLALKPATSIRPLDMAKALETKDSEAARKLIADIEGMRLYLLLNQVRKTMDAEVAAQLMGFYPKLFGSVFSLGAVVSHGDEVNDAIMSREPFLKNYRSHTITRQVMGLARQLLSNR